MYWPTPQDYNEAIQTPFLSIEDPEMTEGEPELNPLGLPKAVTGAFASVYKMRCKDRNVAIRCFLHNIPDQRERYKELSKFLLTNPLDYLVGFEYLERGIKVQDSWFPVLKMEWIDGEPMEQFLAARLNQRWPFETLLVDFVRIVEDMKMLGIAHGDLQHGNILVVKDEIEGAKLKLVDYDGMFVPSLAGFSSNELGHPNYQHPFRKSKHFGPFLDNFSAWIIYASLNCLLQDPTLWTKLSAGDDCLLFRRADFRSPSGAHVFSLLARHASAAVRELSEIVLRLLKFPLPKVPALDADLRAADELGTPQLSPEDEADMKEESESIRLSSIGLPEWSRDGADAEPKGTRIGPWPGIKHYAEAAADPTKNFSDPELARGIPSVFDAAVGHAGMVFYMRCLTRHIAVKCFFQHVPDRAERFEAIARAIPTECRKYFVEFEYQPEGLRVGNYWYPILKMEWAYGMSLNQAAEAYRSDLGFMDNLLLNFRTMMESLYAAQIAHGDLQPANILVVGDNFKLLDYDGMFVPELAGRQSLELGHLHYQHPDRTLDQFDASIDFYSAWVLDTCLMIMCTDHNTWGIINQRLEYMGEDAEWAFRYLDRHLDRSLRQRTLLLAKLAKSPLDALPSLNPTLDNTVESVQKGGVMKSIKRLFQRREN